MENAATGVWVAGAETTEPDTHAAFRAAFTLDAAATMELETLGACWYALWLDGQLLLDGPPRHHPDHPEPRVDRVPLAAGRHVLAAQVHHVGAPTQRHSLVAPYWYARARVDGRALPLAWRGRVLPGYTPRVHRIGNGHPWMEWCDLRSAIRDWQAPGHDDADWPAAVTVADRPGTLRAPACAGCRLLPVAPVRIGGGPLAQRFGWGPEDPAMQFVLRDLACRDLPSGGFWRRYDLGRVRLGRPRFTLDLPAGAIVEFGVSETLLDGRVAPVIPYRGGDGHSALLDHYVAPGGRHTYLPLVPKGGRYLELHVLGADEAACTFVEEGYLERTAYPPSEAACDPGDPLLARIWQTGLETLRGCAEDAVNDCPTRERGQYAGDVFPVALPNAAAGWHDLGLIRRALVQAADAARADGMVPGVYPAQPLFTQAFATYALLWATGAVEYARQSGDRATLERLYPAAQRNIAAFTPFWGADGLANRRGHPFDLGWLYVDWGFEPTPDRPNLPVNLRYLEGLRAMADWAAWLGRTDDADAYRATAETVAAHCRQDAVARLADGGFAALGYHATVLALGSDLIDSALQADAVAFLKRHLLDGFPNRADAPRAAHPETKHPAIITPYFSAFAFPVLLERGETAFVLDQWRTCWGWMLTQNDGSWLEVFDPRWSHCHQWSGSPTWQMSRYLLGLRRRFDLGAGAYALTLAPGPLPACRGRLPHGPDGGWIEVDWQADGADAIAYTVTTDRPVMLHLPAADGAPTTRTLDGRTTLRLTRQNPVRLAGTGSGGT